MDLSSAQIIALGLGGCLGSMVRAALSAAIVRAGAPWVTVFAINVSGSFLIGLGYGGSAAIIPGAGADMTVLSNFFFGFLGGYTTVSTYTLQVLDRWQSGHHMGAVALGAGCVIICPLAAWAGVRALRAGGWS